MPASLGQQPDEEVDRGSVAGAHHHRRHGRLDRPREPMVRLRRQQEEDDPREDQDHHHDRSDDPGEGQDPVVSSLRHLLEPLRSIDHAGMVASQPWQAKGETRWIRQREPPEALGCYNSPVGWAGGVARRQRRVAPGPEGGPLSEERRTGRLLATVTAGVVIGVVEVVLAISFAALVYSGYLAQFLPDGIGLFLVAAAISLAILAWRSGSRGVVGGVQAAVVAVLAVVATTTAQHTFGSSNRAFVTVVAATMVVTILTGITFLVIGTFKRGNLIRFVPYPVVGGFLAGAGWLLLKGGIYVASGEEVHLGTIGSLVDPETLSALAPRPRVRRDPVPRRQAGEDAAGHPDRARGRARAVRDRHARDRLLDRRCANGALDGRTVPFRLALPAVDLPRPYQCRLVGGARTSRRHRHRGARRRDRGPVQRQWHRARAAPRPRHG